MKILNKRGLQQIAIHQVSTLKTLLSLTAELYFFFVNNITLLPDNDLRFSHKLMERIKSSYDNR